MISERCRIAENGQHLINYVNEVNSKSEFTSVPITLSSQNDWNIKDGVLSHKTGGFFHVLGLLTGIEEKKEQLILYQPQSALTGLAFCRTKNNKIYFLLQARVEPGNVGVCQYGATIQATQANYLGLHGGQKSTYIDLFNSYSPDVYPISRSEQFDLGKWYFQKTKTHTIVELPELIETHETMIWASFNSIHEALQYDNFINSDLRSLLGISDWDTIFAQKSLSDNNTLQDKEFYSGLLSTSSNHQQSKLVPLHHLTNWTIRDNGIFGLSEYSEAIRYVQTKCMGREMSIWAQPLMEFKNTGLVELVIRKKQLQYEFLVSIQSEAGISGNKVVFPSCVIYPGDNVSGQIQRYNPGKILAKIIQSDEGGRFFHHESIYQIILCEQDIDIEKNQYWISTKTLKYLLNTSNLMSYQLRCISSLILSILNPVTFPQNSF